MEGGIKKSVMGTLLFWIIVLASLEWNASLYDFIFVGIFNKKYFISSRHFPWLCHLLRFFAKEMMIILGRKNHTFGIDKFNKNIFDRGVSRHKISMKTH